MNEDAQLPRRRARRPSLSREYSDIALLEVDIFMATRSRAMRVGGLAALFNPRTGDQGMRHDQIRSPPWRSINTRLYLGFAISLLKNARIKGHTGKRPAKGLDPTWWRNL